MRAQGVSDGRVSTAGLPSGWPPKPMGAEEARRRWAEAKPLPLRRNALGSQEGPERTRHAHARTRGARAGRRAAGLVYALRSITRGRRGQAPLLPLPHGALLVSAARHCIATAASERSAARRRAAPLSWRSASRTRRVRPPRLRSRPRPRPARRIASRRTGWCTSRAARTGWSAGCSSSRRQARRPRGASASAARPTCQCRLPRAAAAGGTTGKCSSRARARAARWARTPCTRWLM